jgi:hypothetical protein
LQSLPKITPAVARALNSPDVSENVKQQLRQMVDQLKLDVKNNQLDDAKALIGKIVALIKQHAPAEPKPQEGPQVAYTKARLRWTDATRQIQADLSRLATPFVDEFPEDEDLMSKAAQEIGQKLEQFRSALNDVLDDALNAQTPDARQQQQQRALEEIGSFRSDVNSDELLDIIDNGAEGIVNLREALLSALDDIEVHVSG